LHFGRRTEVRLLEPLGKVSEALQEIGANPGEDNLCVYKGRLSGAICRPGGIASGLPMIRAELKTASVYSLMAA
jgi:hypothetical protein